MCDYTVRIHRTLRKTISLKPLWFRFVSPSFSSLFNRNLYGVDANGLVQRAINASNAYDNIASYIEEADKAASLALNTTNRVNDVSNFHTISIYFAALQELQGPKYKLKTPSSWTVSTQFLTVHFASSTLSWIKPWVVNYSASLKCPGIWKGATGPPVSAYRVMLLCVVTEIKAFLWKSRQLPGPVGTRGGT